MKKIAIPFIVFFMIQYSFSQNSTINEWQGDKSFLNKREVTHNNYTLDNTIKLEDADTIPIYKGCNNLESKIEQTNCLITELSIHTRNNFINSGILNKVKISTGINRLRAIFIINRNGSISVKKVLGKNSNLLSDALKTAIESAPKLIPAKSAGKPIPVKFSLKIPFIVK